MAKRKKKSKKKTTKRAKKRTTARKKKPARRAPARKKVTKKKKPARAKKKKATKKKRAPVRKPKKKTAKKKATARKPKKKAAKKGLVAKKPTAKKEKAEAAVASFLGGVEPSPSAPKPWETEPISSSEERFRKPSKPLGLKKPTSVYDEFDTSSRELEGEYAPPTVDEEISVETEPFLDEDTDIDDEGSFEPY